MRHLPFVMLVHRLNEYSYQIMINDTCKAGVHLGPDTMVLRSQIRNVLSRENLEEECWRGVGVGHGGCINCKCCKIW